MLLHTCLLCSTDPWYLSVEKIYFYLGLVALKASVGAPCTNTK